MRAPIVSTLASTLVFYVAMPLNFATATTQSQADALCRKNPNCQTMERGDKGNIYCVRQSGGACKVVVCPTSKPCFVYLTTPPGGGGGNPGGAATTTAGIQQTFQIGAAAPKGGSAVQAGFWRGPLDLQFKDRVKWAVPALRQQLGLALYGESTKLVSTRPRMANV
jgi:hypothetical protein